MPQPSMSPRKKFLDGLVPRLRVPPCPFGGKHYRDICMGRSTPSDLGRRYYWCEHCGKVWGDELTEERRAELRAALADFDNNNQRKSAGRAHNAGVTPTIARQPAPAHPPVIRSSLIEVYLYQKKNDLFLPHFATVKNGTYSFYSDPTFRKLTGFPTARWMVYDRLSYHFVPITIATSHDVADLPFLIVRPSHFADEHCRGLVYLKTILHGEIFEEFKAPSSTIAKRKREVEEDPAPEAGPSTAPPKAKKLRDLGTFDLTQDVDEATQVVDRKGKKRAVEIIDLTDD